MKFGGFRSLRLLVRAFKIKIMHVITKEETYRAPKAENLSALVDVQT